MYVGNFICSLDKKRYSTRNEDRIPNITTANLMSSYPNTDTKEVDTEHRIWRLWGFFYVLVILHSLEGYGDIFLFWFIDNNL